MKQKSALILIGLSLLMAACGGAPGGVQPVDPNDPSVVDETGVYPESDNGNSWSFDSRVPVSTQVYTVVVKVNDGLVNHTETHGSGSVVGFGGYVGGSMRIWQDGKGLLPAEVISLSPAVDFIQPGNAIILKTSDLKAMGLPNGAIVTFICNMDTEILSPVKNSQVLTTDRITYELDDCRMTTPVYSPTQ